MGVFPTTFLPFRLHLLVLVISSTFCAYVPSFSLPLLSTHPPTSSYANFPFPVSLLQIRLTFLSFIFLFSTSLFYISRFTYSASFSLFAFCSSSFVSWVKYLDIIQFRTASSFHHGIQGRRTCIT
jgi:hypothetical protein